MLQKRPNHADILAVDAQLFLSEWRVDGALGRAKEALQADPGSANAHFVMGQIHMARRELEAARRAFIEALRSDPAALALAREEDHQSGLPGSPGP